MNIGQSYTFWSFLKGHKIVIPLIQRDYAQGREGKEELRKRFLDRLVVALRNKNAPLILDFVYGVKDNDNCIIPLDGQQRLTTLWLLHWFLYLKSGKNLKDDVLDNFRHLSYQTRISSRTFCEALCNKQNFQDLRISHSIRKDIMGKTWFISEWEQDPTVKAMLNMLGGASHSIETVIEQSDCGIFWESLINPKNCPISFFYLSIDGEIQQEPDDVYIKINARGEALTDFENFKADLIKHVRDHSFQWASFGSKHPEISLSSLIDVNWSEVFWADLTKKQKQSCKPLPNTDKQLFAFLNCYFFNNVLTRLHLPEKQMNLYRPGGEKYGSNHDLENLLRLFDYLYKDNCKNGESFAYKDFQVFLDGGVINPASFIDLRTIFSVLKDKDIQSTLEATSYGNSFNYLPKLSDEPLTQPQRVVFHGACIYLQKCNVHHPFQTDSFREWMRVVWNIALNADVKTIDNMKGAINKITSIQNYSHDIIAGLNNLAFNNQTDSYLTRQWNEEILKARLYILSKKLINEAEKEFHGSIRFLIDNNNNLLWPQYRKKATKLINDQNWVMLILPYFNSYVFDENQGNKLEFSEKKEDRVKAINRDGNIILAVQNYLMGTNKRIAAADWISTLLIKDSAKNTLLEYSLSKMIRNYYWWDANNPTGVYLYKGSQWKKKDCILLSSFDPTQQGYITKRNTFIEQQLTNDYVFDFSDVDDSLITPDPTFPYEGRAIVLKHIKNTNDRFFCGIRGFHTGNRINTSY